MSSSWRPFSGSGLPASADLGVQAADPSWPIHTKPGIGVLDLPRLRKLTYEDDAIRQRMEWGLAFLERGDRYEKIPWCGTVAQARQLTGTDIAAMCASGKIEPSQRKFARNTVRMFKVPEVAKRRYRPIGWTKNTNDYWTKDTLQQVVFESMRQRHAAAYQGSWAITLDFSAWYDQFEIEENLRDFFTFAHGKDAYRLCRLSMGQRQSVAVGHGTTEHLLNFKRGYAGAYIDNVRFVGSLETVVRDAATFLLRCKAVNATVNEVDVRALDDEEEALKVARSLATQVGEWLGEEVDYESKRIRCCQKTLDKIHTTWTARNTWSWRTFAAHFSLLFYASATLGLCLAPYFAALRCYRRASSALADQPQAWDAAVTGMSPHEWRAIEQWTNAVRENKWRQIPDPLAPTDYVVCTDASAWGWGAIVVDLTTGVTMVHQHPWEHSFYGRFESTKAEPEAVYRALCKTLTAGKRAKVLILTDNTPTRWALPAGYSPSFYMNGIVLKVRRLFPDAELTVEHIPGADMPSDPLSRGLPLTEEHWKNFRGILEGYSERGAFPGKAHLMEVNCPRRCHAPVKEVCRQYSSLCGLPATTRLGTEQSITAPGST